MERRRLARSTESISGASWRGRLPDAVRRRYAPRFLQNPRKVQPWKLFGLMRTNFMEKVEHNTLARKSYSVFILTEYHTHTCAFYSRKSLTMEIVWDFASELRGESRVQLIGKEMSSGLTWC